MSASPELRRCSVEHHPRPLPLEPGPTPISFTADDDLCRTPKAAGCRILPPAACPPAPKKARTSAAPACRRRLLVDVALVRIPSEDLERIFGLPPPPPAAAALPVKKRKRTEAEED